MRCSIVRFVFACAVLWSVACKSRGDASRVDGSYGSVGATSDAGAGAAKGDGGASTLETDAQPTVDAASAGSEVSTSARSHEGDPCYGYATGCYDGGCKSWNNADPRNAGPTADGKIVCYDSDGLVCDFITSRCLPPLPDSPPVGNICDWYQPEYLDTHHAVPQVRVGVASATAKTVATGYTFSCAVISDGTVKCWGDNSKGQLGLGVSYDLAPMYTPPTAVPGLDKAVTISAYDNHACVVLADGHVACWGTWLVSHSTSTTALSPQIVAGLENIVAIDVNKYQACAVDTGGQVWCWGILGYDGIENAQSKQPMPAAPSRIPGVDNAITVSLGELSTSYIDQGMACVLLSSGQAQCWGQGYLGQKGFKPSQAGATGTSTPITVANVSDAVALRGTCILRSSGQTLCWGEIVQFPSVIAEEPVEMVGLDGAVDLAVGSLHVCVLKTTGQARCEALGQYASYVALGDGLNYGTPNTPVDVCNVSNGVAIFAGWESSCALLADGRLVCWGHNDKGQLGHGGQSDFYQPVVVQGL
jgi:alpha-tubulin suppressor-like RCC1 family protein